MAAVTATDSGWQTQAVCIGMVTEGFFPTGTTGPALDQIAQAKTICKGCPVIQQCLNWAIHHGEYGIWGGKTEDERRTLRRTRRKTRR